MAAIPGQGLKALIERDVVLSFRKLFGASVSFFRDNYGKMF